MVVELVHLNLPRNLVGGAMLNLDGQISTIVEAAELTRRDLSPLDGTGLGSQDCRCSLRLIQGADFASTTLTFLGVVYSNKLECQRPKIAHTLDLFLLELYSKIWKRLNQPVNFLVTA